MNDLLRHIYDYTTEHLNLDDPNYAENQRYAAVHYDALLHTLSPEQAAHLRDYRGMAALATDLEREALFTAAFRAGLYLGALARW